MDGLTIVQRLGAGAFLDELNEALSQVSQEVVESGNAATVTVTFKVSAPQKGEPTVIINEEISRKPPKTQARGAFFFAHEGRLHKEDPRQTKMELRVLDGGATDVRDVDEPEAQYRGEAD